MLLCFLNLVVDTATIISFSVMIYSILCLFLKSDTDFYTPTNRSWTWVTVRGWEMTVSCVSSPTVPLSPSSSSMAVLSSPPSPETLSVVATKSNKSLGLYTNIGSFLVCVFVCSYHAVSCIVVLLKVTLTTCDVCWEVSRIRLFSDL